MIANNKIKIVIDPGMFPDKTGRRTQLVQTDEGLSIEYAFHKDSNPVLSKSILKKLLPYFIQYSKKGYLTGIRDDIDHFYGEKSENMMNLLLPFSNKVWEGLRENLSEFIELPSYHILVTSRNGLSSKLAEFCSTNEIEYDVNSKHKQIALEYANGDDRWVIGVNKYLILVGYIPKDFSKGIDVNRFYDIDNLWE